jgi:hypothetical protein
VTCALGQDVLHKSNEELPGTIIATGILFFGAVSFNGIER